MRPMSQTSPPASLDPYARLELSDRGTGVRLTVRVRPKSSRSAVLGEREGGLEVALTAPPVDGAANAELKELLARVFGVRKSNVDIVVGASGRTKIVEVHGIDAPRARERLGRAKR
jgi:uncharacterized protein (TIGR00251 family)